MNAEDAESRRGAEKSFFNAKITKGSKGEREKGKRRVRGGERWVARWRILIILRDWGVLPKEPKTAPSGHPVRRIRGGG